MKIATAQQMREMDRAAIHERGIDSAWLMENAARAVAETAAEAADIRPARKGRRRAVCFCGAGNNGGDGVAAARFLMERGMEVRAVLVGRREKMTPDCREMERRLEDCGGRLEDFTPDDPAFASWCLEADVMVDALFGIGLNTDLHGEALMAVQMMNTCDIPVVSADIASGVEADTGRILGDAVQADVTVTFSLPKAGHFLGEGGLRTGRLVVTEIGIPWIWCSGRRAVFPRYVKMTSICPAVPGTPTREVLGGTISWAARWATQVRRCWQHGLRSGPVRAL